MGCQPEANPEPVYVVTAPPDLRGIYDVWEDVEPLQHGRDICQMLVWGRRSAEAILDGRGVALGPGLHAFTDGNAQGGVGVVLVEGPRERDETPLSEVATSVRTVFVGSGRDGLDREADIDSVLSRNAPAVAELAAVYRAFVEVPMGAEVTVVSDYDGVGKLMRSAEAKPQKRHMKFLVAACIAIAGEKGLRPRYAHYPGHRSSWCGRHDLAHFNYCADRLAREGSGGPPHARGCAQRRKPRLPD